MLTGLTRTLASGQTVTVILTFQNAGAISLSVPVEARSTYYASYLPPAPSASPAKSAKAGATATPTPTLGASAQPSASPSATP